MSDEKGADFKILCVAVDDLHQAHVERLDQVRPHRLVEIEHFFDTYKALEDKTVDILGWKGQPRALEVLSADRKVWELEVKGRSASAAPTTGSENRATAAPVAKRTHAE